MLKMNVGIKEEIAVKSYVNLLGALKTADILRLGGGLKIELKYMTKPIFFFMFIKENFLGRVGKSVVNTCRDKPQAECCVRLIYIYSEEKKIFPPE
ncbi:hypothetical protein [Erwinia sp. 198]|uniref:hypothetical protein n=1 Tax=Erwinia sp. 198 TaxID=2022746 RepID=UPI000F65D532|nr:hypothetical protein [Erwinia sp. 198]RRZ94531.1 hypothetical protein EGK14_05715 [Erwinia sp. 198]